MATSHNMERMVVGEADLARVAAQAPAADPEARAKPAKRRAPEPPIEPKPARADQAPAESKEDAP